MRVNNSGSRGFPLKDNIPRVFGGTGQRVETPWETGAAVGQKKHFPGTVRQLWLARFVYQLKHIQHSTVFVFVIKCELLLMTHTMSKPWIMSMVVLTALAPCFLSRGWMWLLIIGKQSAIYTPIFILTIIIKGLHYRKLHFFPSQFSKYFSFCLLFESNQLCSRLPIS